MPEKLSDIFYFDRAAGRIQKENVLGDGMLRLAYLSSWKGILGWLCFSRPLLSKISGWYADSCLSIKKIASTVKQLEIDMSEVALPETGFTCFNDFFCRKLKPDARPFPKELSIIGAPADCRIRVWNKLDGDMCIPVKGQMFTVSELLGAEGKFYIPRFLGGALCVCRLCPADYHRFHFPDDGIVLASWKIPGRYHSVNPIALNQNINVFGQNVRQVTILQLKNFGLCAYIEVGAFGVASITQTYQENTFLRGQEKGYFTFGGSTVIMIFEPGKIVYDEDLQQYSSKDMEVRLKCGNAMGRVREE